MNDYHKPVMLSECLDGLNINPNGIYVDVTFGGGGHSKEILKKLKDGKLYAFDQDSDAEANKLADDNFVFIKANFRYLKNFLKLNRVLKINGLLADLGISSYQINEPDRGFSIRYDSELDMRMDNNTPLTAKEIINTYSDKSLMKIFSLYGELNNSYKITQLITNSRKEKGINTTFELKSVLKPIAPRNKENKFFAQVFQALRIEVNDELKVLEEMLLQASDLLESGGRMVIMSYHSLEDRIVKNFFKTGNFEGKIEKDFYGNINTPFKIINRKVITASKEEIETNNRARSAKLRIIEKI